MFRAPVLRQALLADAANACVGDDDPPGANAGQERTFNTKTQIVDDRRTNVRPPTALATQVGAWWWRNAACTTGQQAPPGDTTGPVTRIEVLASGFPTKNSRMAGSFAKIC